MPLPIDHGWDINQETIMPVPVWSEDPTLPPSLADLVHDPFEQQDEKNDSDESYNVWYF